MTVKELRTGTYLKVDSVRILNAFVNGSDELICLREEMKTLRDYDDYEVDEVQAIAKAESDFGTYYKVKATIRLVIHKSKLG